MSQHKPRPSESSLLSSTRHMLDELDELMERMLALPVNDLEDQTLAPPAADEPDEPETAEPPSTDVEPEPTPSYQAEVEEAPVSPYSAIAAPIPDRFAENGTLPSLTELHSETTFESPPRQERQLWRLLLKPLFWINRSFDVCTYWMGNAGRWLRSTRGRSVIGYVGLGLLAVSVLWWFRNLLGWTG